MDCPYCGAKLDQMAQFTNICSVCRGIIGTPEHTIRTVRIEKLSTIQSSRKKFGAVTEPFDDFTAENSIGDSPSANSLPIRDFQRKGEIRDCPGDFRIIRQIGEGGMGKVEEASQVALDRHVAVKWLTNWQRRENFLREARVTGNLEHPNIVPIYDLGVDAKDQIFYTMRQIRGKPWSELLESKSLPENIDILLTVCDAVAFAHSKGVIHRDLKPENVMLGDYDEILVVDWGLAAGMTDASAAPAVTYADAIAGTPAYMAPEMANGEEWQIGYHSDIYLLGAILFELVTGQLPHAGKTVNECLQNAAENRIAETWVDSQLLKTAKIAMATDPQQRFKSVGELQTAIRQHSRSVMLATRARKTLAIAEKKGDYLDYFRAIGGLLEALEIWEDNEEARQALNLTAQQLANFAQKNGDAYLAKSLKKIASTPT